MANPKGPKGFRLPEEMMPKNLKAITKPTTGKTVDCVWAFIASDEHGDEGLPAIKVGNTWMPMVGADEARVNALRPFAEQMATKSGQTIRLCKFMVRWELETFKPKADGKGEPLDGETE